MTSMKKSVELLRLRRLHFSTCAGKENEKKKKLSCMCVCCSRLPTATLSYLLYPVSLTSRVYRPRVGTEGVQCHLKPPSGEDLCCAIPFWSFQTPFFFLNILTPGLIRGEKKQQENSWIMLIKIGKRKLINCNDKLNGAYRVGVLWVIRILAQSNNWLDLYCNLEADRSKVSHAPALFFCTVLPPPPLLLATWLWPGFKIRA